MRNIDLPLNSFNKVAKNYSLDEWKLKAEYKSFIESYRKVKEAASKTQIKDLSLEKADIKRENFVTVLQLISNITCKQYIQISTTSKNTRNSVYQDRF